MAYTVLSDCKWGICKDGENSFLHASAIFLLVLFKTLSVFVNDRKINEKSSTCKTCMNVCSDFICNVLKIETTKMSFKKWTVKLWYIHIMGYQIRKSKNKRTIGISLVVWWLRIWAANVGALGSLSLHIPSFAHVFFQKFFSDIYPEDELLGHIGSSIFFFFEKSPYYFPQRLHQFTYSPTVYEEPSSLHILANVLFVLFFYDSHSDRR